jgi:outer membrane biogenesis lipoprotein LolB
MMKKRSDIRVSVRFAMLAPMLLSGCAWFQHAPAVPLKEATAMQLTGRLQEREAAIQTMKGLFRAQIAGSGIPIAQRMEGAMYYRRPESLRLQGFNHLGGKLFEFSQNKTQYRLDLPAEGKRFAGSLEELPQAKIGRLLQLSRWAVGGVVGDDSSAGGSRATLAEDGDRYRLDVFQSSPEGRLLRRLWFERRSLQVVQEERLGKSGDVEASMTFEDYRGIPAAPASVTPTAEGSAGVTLMPFKVTIVDRIIAGSMVLTFHEIVLNPSLKPEELGLAARSGEKSHENPGG